MAKNLILIFLILLYVKLLAAQVDIYSILHNEKEIKYGNAKHIEWTTIDYGAKATSFIEKNISMNKNNQIIHMIKNNDDLLTQIFFFEFDSITGNKQSFKLITKYPSIGDVTRTLFYIYDDNKHLIKTKCYNTDNLFENYTLIKNNEDGYPIELRTYDINDSPTGGYERVIYLFDQNKYIDMVYSDDSILISKTINILNFSENYKFSSSDKEYNENGDIIKSDIQENSYNLYDYKYDTLGNWIRFDKYAITILPDGKQIKKRTNTCTRKIAYW
jgi:hypothetical protein